MDGWLVDACGDVLNGFFFNMFVEFPMCCPQHVPIAPHFVPYALSTFSSWNIYIYMDKY
jgi:hypothetical protein